MADLFFSGLFPPLRLGDKLVFFVVSWKLTKNVLVVKNYYQNNRRFRFRKDSKNRNKCLQFDLK